MDDLKVRIENLAPMGVASVRVVSEHPEAEAWAILRAWAEPRGLFDDPEQHPVFGFNNPNPTPARKQYGYEFWIRVDPDTEGTESVEIKNVAGGPFAVTTYPDYPNPETWKRLWEWVQGSSIWQWRKDHELERVINPRAPENEVVFDLYLPIESRSNPAPVR